MEHAGANVMKWTCPTVQWCISDHANAWPLLRVCEETLLTLSSAERGAITFALHFYYTHAVLRCPCYSNSLCSISEPFRLQNSL